MAELATITCPKCSLELLAGSFRIVTTTQVACPNCGHKFDPHNGALRVIKLSDDEPSLA